MASSSKPTVLTQYPRDQKCSPVTRFIFNNSRWIRTALLPFKNPIAKATLYLGGMLKHIWIWSGIRCPSTISRPFWLHNSLIICPTPFRNFPNSFLLRYFGTVSDLRQSRRSLTLWWNAQVLSNIGVGLFSLDFQNEPFPGPSPAPQSDIGPNSSLSVSGSTGPF